MFKRGWSQEYHIAGFFNDLRIQNRQNRFFALKLAQSKSMLPALVSRMVSGPNQVRSCRLLNTIISQEAWVLGFEGRWEGRRVGAEW